MKRTYTNQSLGLSRLAIGVAAAVPIPADTIAFGGAVASSTAPISV